MKKLLVTGVTGQVGYEIANLLGDRYQVTGSGRNTGGECSIDLANPESIRQAIQHLRPDIIVNCGAYTQVDKAETDRTLAFQVNRDAAKTFADEAKKLGSLLIHFSTDYVFDGRGSSPHREVDAVGPINVYGESKLAGELAIVESGCDFIILRTSWVFSARGNNFVKTMLRLGKERAELGVVSDQIGAPTSALALVRAVVAILDVQERKPAKKYSGIYHCACRGETSWHGFATEIFSQARHLGFVLEVKDIKQVPTTAYPTPARRPLNSRLDCRKFEQTFEFAMVDWQGALREVLDLLKAAHAEN